MRASLLWWFRWMGGGRAYRAGLRARCIRRRGRREKGGTVVGRTMVGTRGRRRRPVLTFFLPFVSVPNEKNEELVELKVHYRFERYASHAFVLSKIQAD